MRRMKNFEDILRGIPSAGTKNRAETMRSSGNGGYEFYTDYDGGVVTYDVPNEERTAMAEPPKDITVDNSISDALMRLSLTDRNKIEEEVHGIVREPEETPEFLNWCLREFDKELMIVKNSKERLRHLRAHSDVLKNVIRTDFSHVEDGISDSESTIDSNGPVESRSDSSANANSNQSKSSCYVNDRKVRLRFIRAERYNCKKAVTRFVNFLSFAKELYGDFVADRPIQLSDLKTRKEKWALSNISFQFLPFRDRSGRRVFVSVGTCGYDIEPLIRIKILWYMYWIASEDIESQQKGVVIIGWPSDSVISQSSDDETNGSDGSNGGGSMESENNVWEDSLRQNLVVEEGIYQVKALDGLPMRIAALHTCFEDRPIYRLLNSLFHFSMNPYLKARYKVHIGEPLEIRYKLQGFGIPTDSLPLTHTMAFKRQNHAQWIALRKRIERNQEGTSTDGNGSKGNGNKCKKVTTPSPLPFNPDDLVECPRSYDVIIGKAKYQNNPGNVFYRSLIEATHDEHISSSKREKVELTWRIVRQMEKRKGRFLEMNKSLKAWVHIKDRNVMRQKVAQSFKEYKRNAGVVRSKRNLHWHKNPSSSSPKIPGKRIKTVRNPRFENDCFTGCFSGFDCDKTNDFVITPDENSSDLVVSRSAFASLW